MPVGVWGTVVVLVVVVCLGAGVQRFASGAERAARPPADGASVGAGMFGGFVEVFQPSLVHLTEEKERRRLDIVQRPAEGAPLVDVDLETGVAVLRAAVPASDPRLHDAGP